MGEFVVYFFGCFVFFCFGGFEGNDSCDLFFQYNCCREFLGGRIVGW